MPSIAGHTFNAFDLCDCGKRWADVRDVTRDCIGKDGYAHVSNLTENEYNEIVGERDRRAEAAWSAIQGVCAR